MIRVKTLTIQLIDAQPDRIRICRVEGESLVTIVIPREDLAEAKALPNIPQRGIYYLLDEDHGNVSRVYAGQTTQGIARLDAHKARKEFWNKAVMFLDDDQNISKDALDVLEAKAIDYVRTHGSYETDNSVTPKPYIDPYKEESVEHLHGRILFRMAALGYDLDRVDQGPVGAPIVFHTKKNGIRGTGRYDKATGHFTVLAGSEVNLLKPVLKNASVASARSEIFSGITGVAKLSEDLEFPTPSAAAVFVLGGSQNGWTEWVDNDGETLNQVYRSEDE
ncbi:MAG: GIY-YIG nuclease family protein [Slackia sp.]|nr:GIY-YIG nuclease family protein [Slackia sp.]